MAAEVSRDMRGNEARARGRPAVAAACALAALALAPAACWGQVRLALRLEHASTIRFEPIIAFVTLVNGSDLPLVIDPYADVPTAALAFQIERTRGEALARTSESPIVRHLLLRPDGRREVMADLTRWYDMGRAGRYTVRATVTWNGETYVSEPAIVDVVAGIEMESVTQTVPDYTDEVRKYSIRYWVREGHEYLFLSAEDTKTGVNYGVFLLGKLVRFTKPTLEVDRKGRVKVMHQSGGACFTRSYFQVSRDGIQFVDQTYHLASGDPYPFAEAKDEKTSPAR